MFRRPLLPCALLPCGLLAVAFGMALVLVPAPARSQDRSTQERLDRLERDLNMLQRQVYRGLPSPPSVLGGDGGGAVNTEIRINQIEAQMRDLTGRVEEFMNQIAQVRQRVEQINADIDMRSNRPGSGPLASADAAPSRPGSAAASRGARQYPPPPPDAAEDDAPPLRLAPSPGRSDQRGSLMPPGTVPPPGAGPAPIYGTLTPPGTGVGALPAEPEQLASAGGHPPAAGALPSGSATTQYNQAFGLLKQADYPAAEAALKSFVEQHPKDPMAGNAQYWLGETFYTRSRYLDAASAFAEGYKRYPKSAKAADGLLKLGMSLARANQKQNACVALGQLDQAFPNPGAAIKDRAAAEKKRLGC